jgi:cytochrome c-type biogenesis protein
LPPSSTTPLKPTGLADPTMILAALMPATPFATGGFLADAAGTNLTIAVAIGAGLLSFLSPCVLPLVPAYLGQLTAVAVSATGERRQPSRWVALRHAAAYVIGFGSVFTLLGVTATFAGGPLFASIGTLRVIGGVILIVLGISLTGLIRIPILERVWRPLDAGAATALAGSTGTIALGSPGAASDHRPRSIDRLGSRLVGRGGLAASFGLGAIFAIGWTPCIGIILGGILTVAATSGSTIQGGILLIAYTLGLGIPFLALGLLYDRAPGLLRPLVRRGRAVSIVGGLLVIAIGIAMITGWLGLLPRYFTFNTAI